MSDTLESIIDEMQREMVNLQDDSMKSSTESSRDLYTSTVLQRFILRLKRLSNRTKQCEHDWITMHTIHHTEGVDDMVRWCNECGAFQIVAESDGRYAAHFTQPIQLPRDARK